MPSHLFSLRLMFVHSKSESLHDVSVTRIGDTLSYGFPQTVLRDWLFKGRGNHEMNFSFTHSKTEMLGLKRIMVKSHDIS